MYCLGASVAIVRGCFAKAMSEQSLTDMSKGGGGRRREEVWLRERKGEGPEEEGKKKELDIHHCKLQTALSSASCVPNSALEPREIPSWRTAPLENCLVIPIRNGMSRDRRILFPSPIHCVNGQRSPLVTDQQ